MTRSQGWIIIGLGVAGLVTLIVLLSRRGGDDRAQLPSTTPTTARPQTGATPAPTVRSPAGLESRIKGTWDGQCNLPVQVNEGPGFRHIEFLDAGRMMLNARAGKFALLNETTIEMSVGSSTAIMGVSQSGETLTLRTSAPYQDSCIFYRPGSVPTTPQQRILGYWDARDNTGGEQNFSCAYGYIIFSRDLARADNVNIQYTMDNSIVTLTGPGGSVSYKYSFGSSTLRLENVQTGRFCVFD